MNELEDRIVEMLKTIYDPEIPVDIFELGPHLAKLPCSRVFTKRSRRQSS
jgi:hypothetical protein